MNLKKGYKKYKRKYNRIIKKMTPNQKKLWSVLKFLIIFNALAIPVQLIINFKVNLYPLQYVERAQVSFFLDLFRVKHVLYDIPYQNGQLPAININNQVLAIGEPCTALRSLLAFVALVIASPKTWGAKKRAMIYLPIIYLVNIIRIVSLAFVSLSFPSLFDLIHVLMWREGLIVLIIGLWFYWFKKND